MRIIDVETMRRLEAETIAAGTSGYRLMRRAGEGAAELIREFAGNRFRRAVVLAGGGNNGGDALVVAALLDMPVTVYATRPLTELRGEARQAARDLPDHVHVEERTELDDSDFRPGDLIVDGLCRRIAAAVPQLYRSREPFRAAGCRDGSAQRRQRRHRRCRFRRGG